MIFGLRLCFEGGRSILLTTITPLTMETVCVCIPIRCLKTSLKYPLKLLHAPHRFYKKAGFYDNRCKNGDGGAVDNLGKLK